MKIILALVTVFLFGFALFSSAFADKTQALSQRQSPQVEK